MAGINQKPPRIYQNVSIIMISWKIDGDFDAVRSLARIFRDIFHYIVQEVKLTIAGERDLYGLLHETYKWGEDDLQIVYYIGGIEHRPHGDWNGMVAVPISQTRQKLTLDPESDWLGRLEKFLNAKEMFWLEYLIQIPNLLSDVLVILDCPAKIEGFSFVDFGNGTFRLQVMTAGYKDPSFEPGAFTSCLAGLLENAANPVSRMRRKEFITTSWLLEELCDIDYLPGQEIEPSLAGNFVKDDYLEPIVLEPIVLPSFEHGSHHELSRYDQAKIFGNMLLIHENGLTEVFKAQIFQRSQEGNETNEAIICAIKRFKPRNALQAKSMAIAFQKEREILSSLSIWKHAHILGFISSFEVPSEPKFGHYNLILPYAEGGDLHQFLRLPSPPEWLFTGPGCIPFCKTLYIQTKGIVDGLGFLHAKTSSAGYVIHRDIKPANILIHNATFKIADFGSSRIKASEETSKTEWAVGTLMYAPPEKTLEDSDMYGRARDVWALGCVMLEILVLLLYGFREPAAVEVFERERLESTKKDVKAFSRTMECVEVWMANIDGLLQTGHVREKDRWVDEDWDNEQKMLRTLLGAIRSMLKVNRLERVESSRVLEYLTVS